MDQIFNLGLTIQGPKFEIPRFNSYFKCLQFFFKTRKIQILYFENVNNTCK